MPHGSTGLCAAWVLNEYATFRIVTFYIRSHPSDDLLKRLGFREESSGSKVWIVVPKDEGVLHGSNKVEGIRLIDFRSNGQNASGSRLNVSQKIVQRLLKFVTNEI